jgi:AcrR family transcriptional regulator
MILGMQTEPDRPVRRRRLGVEGQRMRLRDAAAVVFATQAVESASVEAVIRQAGVSRQTFYRCYDSKAELVDDVYQHTTELLFVAMRAADAGSGTPADSLHRQLERLFAFASSAGPVLAELDRRACMAGSGLAAKRAQRRQLGTDYALTWLRRHLGLEPDLALIHGVILGIEQLVLEAAEGGPGAVETGLRASLGLVKGALLVMGAEPAMLQATGTGAAR